MTKWKKRKRGWKRRKVESSKYGKRKTGGKQLHTMKRRTLDMSESKVVYVANL